MKKLILAVGMVIAMCGMAMAQLDYAATMTWTAPTSGSAVDHYVVEIYADDVLASTIPSVLENTYQITGLNFDVVYKVRVAGVDAFDRMGPWSLFSNDLIDAGPPGVTGVPVLVAD